MPSGKRARQQRREAAMAPRTPPPVRSKGVGGVRRRQASPRALMIAGGVVLVAVIAIVLGVVLSSGSGGSGGNGGVLDGLPAIGSATWAGALDGAPEANGLFKGIPQKGFTLGKPTAPVEMQLFIDVQCPLCQEYEVSSLPTVVEDNIKTGKAQIDLQPWAFLGAQSFSGRLGLIAASFQNKGYEYAKVLYDNQQTENTGWLTSRQMALIAASVTGLNLKRWWSDVNSSDAKSIADEVSNLAKKKKIQGTPTVLVGCTGGTLQDVTTPGLVPTLQQTQQAIDGASCS